VVNLEQSYRRAIYLTLGVSTLLYFLQAFGPLRLTTDSISYLSLADSATTQGVIHAFRQPNFPFPKGYPVFVFLLMKSGLFFPATIVITNLLFFAVGITFSFRTLIALGFQRNHAAIACLLTLLSFTAVKHITQGMSDFLFFALSAAACWSMTLHNRYKWLVIVPCAVCAIEVRFIGLALIFPLAAMAWPLVRRRPVAIVVIGVMALIFVGAGTWAGRHYLAKNFQLLKNNGLSHFLGNNIIAHCQDFAELMANISLSKLPAWSSTFMLIMGGFALLLFLGGIVALWGRSQWSCFYMLGYSALILPWPYTDPRFWLPAMPFVFLTMHAGAIAFFKKMPKRVVAAYGIIFCTLGFAALGYSTWLAFSGPKFPYRYGDGLLRSTYLAGCSVAPADANQKALHLLRRYDWRCPNEPR